MVSSSPASLCWGARLCSSLLLELLQKTFWFMTRLANWSHSTLIRGVGGNACTQPLSTGSKNVWEPHVTLSCLREVIPQASQRYFGEGGFFISHIPLHWQK